MQRPGLSVVICNIAMRWLPHIGMAVIGLAGLSKCLDISEFLAALQTWKFLPEWSHGAFSLAIPATEIILAGLWFCGVARRSVVKLTLAFVAVLAAAYAFHAFVLGAPKCGCMGALGAYLWSVEDRWFVVGRNLFLMGLLAPSLRRRADGPPRLGFRAVEDTEETPTKPPLQRAFSLLELLVVVLILGILLALGVPIFAKSRDRARVASDLSQLSQHARIIGGVYLSSSAEAFPWFARPVPEPTLVSCVAQSFSYPIRYFDSYNIWNVALADKFYDGLPWGRVFRSPTIPRSIVVNAGGPSSPVTDYLYPCVFLGAPDQWRLRGYTTAPTQLRATRVSEVAYPTEKVLLWTSSDGVYGSEMPRSPRAAFNAAFVDGHAASAPLSNLRLEFAGDIVNNDYGDHYARSLPSLLHTWHGVAGRDVGAGNPADEE